MIDIGNACFDSEKDGLVQHGVENDRTGQFYEESVHDMIRVLTLTQPGVDLLWLFSDSVFEAYNIF